MNGTALVTRKQHYDVAIIEFRRAFTINLCQLPFDFQIVLPKQLVEIYT